MKTILYGPDESLIAWHLSQLKAGYDASEIETIDALTDSQDRLYQALDSMDLFSPRKLVIVENASFLASKNKTEYDLNEILPHLMGDTDLVIVCPTDKLDSRKKGVKQLLKTAKAIECKPLDARTASTFVEDELKKQKVHLDWQAKDWFIRHVGTDPLRITREIEKLSLFGDRPGLEDVKALVTVEPVDNIFAMADALAEQNGLRLLAFYRNFRSLQMEPVAICLILASQVRFLFQVRCLMDRGLDKNAIAKELGAHPFRVSQNMKKAAGKSAADLQDMLETLADLDQALKSGKISQDESFESFCLRFVV